MVGLILLPPVSMIENFLWYLFLFLLSFLFFYLVRHKNFVVKEEKSSRNFQPRTNLFRPTEHKNNVHHYCLKKTSDNNRKQTSLLNKIVIIIGTLLTFNRSNSPLLLLSNLLPKLLLLLRKEAAEDGAEAAASAVANTTASSAASSSAAAVWPAGADRAPTHAAPEYHPEDKARAEATKEKPHLVVAVRSTNCDLEGRRRRPRSDSGDSEQRFARCQHNNSC